MAALLGMSRTERVVVGIVGLLAVAAVAGVFWLVLGELSPAQQHQTSAVAAPEAAPLHAAPDAGRDASLGKGTGAKPADGTKRNSGVPKRGGKDGRRPAGDTATMKPSPDMGPSGVVSGRVVDD